MIKKILLLICTITIFSLFTLPVLAVEYDLQVGIPTFGGPAASVDGLAAYIKIIFQFGVSLAAVLATVMIMAGGFIWLTSGGSPDKVGRAKDFILSAVLGLLLALFSFILLTAINPQLTFLRDLWLPPIGDTSGGNTSGGSTGGESGSPQQPVPNINASAGFDA